MFVYREIAGRLYSPYNERQDRLTFLSLLPPEDLFNELLDSYVNTEIAVQHPELFQKLSFNQQLEIFATHKPFAQIMLTYKKFLHKLKAEHLRHLGLQSVEIADYILQNLELFGQLSEEEKDQLKQEGFDIQATHSQSPNTEVVKQILDEPSNYSTLAIDRLQAWGQSDPALAQRILDIDELEQKMARFNLHAYENVKASARVGSDFSKICRASTRSDQDMPSDRKRSNKKAR